MRNKILFDQYADGLKPGELPFNKAFSDAYYPPKITKIDIDNYRGCKGDRIRIDATDDFKVVRVRVAILNFYNDAIEKGCARYNGSDGIWTYKAKTDIPDFDDIYIRVTAFDLAGNRKTVKKYIILPPL